MARSPPQPHPNQQMRGEWYGRQVGGGAMSMHPIPERQTVTPPPTSNRHSNDNRQVGTARTKGQHRGGSKAWFHSEYRPKQGLGLNPEQTIYPVWRQPKSLHLFPVSPVINIKALFIGTKHVLMVFGLPVQSNWLWNSQSSQIFRWRFTKKTQTISCFNTDDHWSSVRRASLCQVWSPVWCGEKWSMNLTGRCVRSPPAHLLHQQLQYNSVISSSEILGWFCSCHM